MNKIKYFLVVQFLFSQSLCEINNDQKEKFLGGFLKHYNSLPNQVYQSEEGSLQNTQQEDDTTYKIEANLKVAEISNNEAKKTLKCVAFIKDSENEVTVLSSNCEEVADQPRQSDGVPETSMESHVEVTEPTVERKPVQLDNEVQQDTAITSGEQFIAIPRDQPKAPCIGCASHVNPQAAGVSDLAELGVRHLDLHEPSVKHSLVTVKDVERQVQVVNGVRYILTLSINFNNCTQVESENCALSKICKITILVKPWVKLSNGGNYRAILANNCTEEWQFGENGEVLPEPLSDNNQRKENSPGDPAGTNAFDDDIKVKHETNVQSQPNQEKTLSEDDIKKIQEQIITDAQFQAVTESNKESFTLSPDLSDVSKQHVFKAGSEKHNENSIPVTESQTTEQQAFKLNADKKKAIDEMLDFFDFAGFKPKTEIEEVFPRVRRSYDYDLQVLSLAEDYHGIKNSILNARFMYEMAQAMVDYINEMDMEVKNRAVKNVIRAEEEKEDLHRFVYIQARVTIPCDKVECEPRAVDTQICNGVIDCINENSPQILSTFCYNDNKESDYREDIREVALNDPVLRRLAEEAVKEIESESKSEYAMRLNKIASAITQVTSGTLTKFSVIIENIKCNKSVPLPLRENCTVLEQLGSKICDVIVHERHWLKEKKMSYSCTDRPADMRISKSKKVSNNITVDDPQIIEMLQEAIQYLESQSDKTNKQKIVNIKSISSQIIAGFLTKIEFVVGYTDCTDDNYSRDQINKCELLKGEGLRLCKAQIWDRSWIMDGRQIEVSCDDVLKNNEILKTRKKRSIDFGRDDKQSLNKDSEVDYKKLAVESLYKFMQSSSSNQHYEVVKVDKTMVPDESRKLIKIEFSISPTNCLIQSNGILSSSKCNILNPKNILHCRSKILENNWIDKKQYFVKCNIKYQQQIKNTNTIKERNPSDSKYYQLAAESLKKYLHDTGNQPHTIVRVEKVTTQIVAGLLTRIDFIISPKNQSNGKTVRCYSEILEKHWMGTKAFNVSCQLKQDVKTMDHTVEIHRDNPKYMQIAVESLQKYIKNHPESNLVRVAFVDKVERKSEKLKIRFIASHAEEDNGDTLCNAEVTETKQSKSDIEVTCYLIDKLFIKSDITENDPNYNKYVQLADESLRNYIQKMNSSLYTVVTIEGVAVLWDDGIKTLINFTISPVDIDNTDLLQGKHCFAEILEQPWLQNSNNKNIQIDCKQDKDLYRTKREALNDNDRRQLGGLQEQNPSLPEYKALAEESLRKYIIDSGIRDPLIVTQIEKVTTQVVSGTMTRIDFLVSGSLGTNLNKCHSEVWTQPWRNFKQITVTCENDGHRGKRQVPGGLKYRDPTKPEYRLLAEESLRKYSVDNGISDQLVVVQVENVTTQVVAGALTRIDFLVSGSPDAKINRCHSEIWTKPWINFKQITVTCENNSHRGKRQLPGGLENKDPTKQEYRLLAEESLRKYSVENGIRDQLVVVQVEKVTTQVVAGALTRIDFLVSGSPGEKINKCHSEIWTQVWRNIKEIRVTCSSVNGRVKRDLGSLSVALDENISTPMYKILTVQSTRGNTSNKSQQHELRGHSDEEQDPTKLEYKLMAEESLRKLYQKRSTVYHTVLDIQRVFTRVVSGIKYKIDFTAAPTACSVNISSLHARSCKPIDDVILYCHTEIWDKPWLRQKKIDVQCNDPNNDNFSEDESDNNLPTQKSNVDKFKQLAEEATEKYLTTSNRKYVHKVTEILSSNEQVANDTFTNINFTISPTTCLRNETTNNTLCKLKQPLVAFNCNANIRVRQLQVEKEIKVTCKKVSETKRKKRKSESGVRTVRQIVDDDEEIDEDTAYYYADRAVQHINDRSNSNNLNKLISIYAVKNSVQMGTMTIKMYIEVAETYCLKHHKSTDLRNCEEMSGLNHRLCLARLWPSPDDELVVRQVSVVCDDEEDFMSVTGVNIMELIRISLAVLESPPENKFKLVHQGEPQLIPSLDSRRPFKLNFVVSITNCSKDVNLDKNPFQCFLNPSVPPRNCHSLIWLKPEAKFISNVDAQCAPLGIARYRRSALESENGTDYSEIQSMVKASLEQLEMQSLHRYKQRVLQINSHSTKITSGKVTTIDFDVGYTSCLKYEWVANITSCNFLEHLPRRRCVAQIWQRLWIKNGKNIDVNCVDDETPLESHIEFESAEMANELARQALKHIEAKYPHPAKQKVVRIFSLEKQVVAGIHYKMKIEVGITDCVALSEQKECKLVSNHGLNKFCRVNVWIRPWTDHPPNFRVSCDYQEGNTHDLYHQVQAEHLFYNFLTTYSPSYVNNYSQMHKRFEIFKNNIKKIHELNVHEKGTAVYGVTRFSDLTYEEFRTTYMGLNTNLSSENQVPMKQADIPSIKVPENFDWRDYDAVTEVKDQGSCGSCWAFSVTGNIEGQWKMQSGQLVSLSEQELVDCDKLDNGCNGGLPDNAYRAIEQMGGLELESDYPYEGTDDKCAFNKTLAKVQISSAVNITTNETGMAQWLVHNGPISIGINANAMQFYMGGISHPWKALCNPTNLDHGVLIVGYGVKDYPLFHKKIPYWIIKNSWGKSWGEQGYYRVFRGDGTCGVNQMASSAVI